MGKKFRADIIDTLKEGFLRQEVEIDNEVEPDRKGKTRDNFGVRMKGYEKVSDISLRKKEPVICRVDQRAGHTFTKGLVKPHDNVYIETMQRVMKEMSRNIQGCVFGYTQSDEISYVLIDYQTEETEAFFGYRIQKMNSILSSMATRNFNKYFREVTEEFARKGKLEIDKEIYEEKYDLAEFDSRVFNVPKEEVVNTIYWRQKDAERNSIQGLGQSIFSSRELHGVSNKELQEKIIEKTGRSWDELPVYKKWGTACYKGIEVSPAGIERTIWELDKEMPKLLGEGREYLGKWL